MKYLCLGYMDEAVWNGLAKTEQDALMGECFAYDEELERNGHFVRGEALQRARSATLRFRDGRVMVTDGPFAETKEHLGGLLVLEADDLEHAIRLMTRHPGVRVGPFEIYPIDEVFTAQANARRVESASR